MRKIAGVVARSCWRHKFRQKKQKFRLYTTGPQCVAALLPICCKTMITLLSFILYPYESNYLLYTYTIKINKQAISSYDWAKEERKDEVNFQLSLAFPIWRGIMGDNSLLGVSYTQQSWWQISNADESSPFRETNYETQIFLG